jgi:hypothetical protein
MESQEVGVCLWYVRDQEGIIYSLRAKAYVLVGSDDEKLKFLENRAQFDYLVAEAFDVPTRFHVKVSAGRRTKRMPVGHVSLLDALETSITLFEDAIRTLEDRFPAQSDILVPKDPLVCTTPLMQNSKGVIEPRVTRQIHY